MPRAWRSCSDSSCGLTVTGSPGSRPRRTPPSPAATAAPSARYGLALPSTALISMLVLASTRPRNGDATRTAASRLSGPQAVYAELHMFGARRRYELTLGHVIANNPGRCCSTPATNDWPSCDSPRRPPGSKKALRSARQTLRWTWQPLLARAELGVVLARLESLLVERVQDRSDRLGGAVHAVRAEAQAVVSRHEPIRLDLARQVELVLEGGLDRQPLERGAL